MEPEASGLCGIRREVGSSVHLLCPCGRRMQQEDINTCSQGSLRSQKGTDSLVEMAGDRIAIFRLLGKPFPELLRALKTSGLVFLADLCCVKCVDGFHSNTPEASSKHS